MRAKLLLGNVVAVAQRGPAPATTGFAGGVVGGVAHGLSGEWLRRGGSLTAFWAPAFQGMGIHTSSRDGHLGMRRCLHTRAIAAMRAVIEGPAARQNAAPPAAGPG